MSHAGWGTSDLPSPGKKLRASNPTRPRFSPQEGSRDLTSGRPRVITSEISYYINISKRLVRIHLPSSTRVLDSQCAPQLRLAF